MVGETPRFAIATEKIENEIPKLLQDWHWRIAAIRILDITALSYHLTIENLWVFHTAIHGNWQEANKDKANQENHNESED